MISRIKTTDAGAYSIHRQIVICCLQMVSDQTRDVCERYVAKSDPYIVMISTPNVPEGLFERIEKEPEDKRLYVPLFLDYTYGLNRIYTPEEIERARKSPSFDKEYDLKYVGKIGNVFHQRILNAQ